MKTLCAIASGGEVADAILCDKCKETASSDFEVLYEQMTFEDDKEICDSCGDR